MNKKVKIGIFSLAALAAAFWGINALSSSSSSRIKLETTAVTSEHLATVVTATGTVEPLDEIEVGTQVSGQVKSIYVDYNSEVKKGQLLAELDKTLLIESVTSAQASYAASLNELQYYTQNYNRQKQMFDEGVISKQDFEQAEYQYNNSKSVSQQRETALKQAKTNLSYATIYSPIDGVILTKDVKEGQTVAASFNTPTLFTIAKDLTKMLVEADVDEADIGGVAVGQRVTFTVDAYPNEEFDGIVKQVRLGATVTSNVVTYTVIVEADNSANKLKPGLTATITIYTQELPNTTSIKVKALSFDPDLLILEQYYIQEEITAEENSMPSGSDPNQNPNMEKVWLRDKNGLLQPKTVETGMSDGIHVQILSGLDLGDEVITDLSREEQRDASGQGGSPFMPKPPSQNKKAN
ncbi:efflux RND transporter periplasmic adaptor subunit [uncultured Algoriphagus sp.]|uniref:efflux RND transporter periplasmic adaptor subunit n=1 Tax=uncultured Algoriphagus sp. TaxID=417365 RepID=UPI0030ECB125|tara:strand:+ start:33632 stop:34858 length:1227 start_codon:yes stop_codon:yes gene_type:complete